jgi:hypothetical protein
MRTTKQEAAAVHAKFFVDVLFIIITLIFYVINI